ncbi:MAG: dimethyl sulfoxide reductase anchor subunit [Proteobacteria bacterium]|nr:dimethyl sulfoxide reductase anchor subunit [Pseudomonadota bacterium]
MFQVRTDEPDYTFLKDPETEQCNRYGQLIDLAELSGQPRGVSLRINGDEGVGANPNRYKQHGFHFTADNCIGCHACEAACSEKNDLPAHLSFRAVGYVEGGTYPNFTRMNISMACNHCDDPVCPKGCPTRAYTKHAEYGAVIQDPEICFGCGYCTWVCPYNAPQLDPIEGHVQKCNMCVDRLEVGLKPACVSACLGNALEFGVVENLPDNREQVSTAIPGFPSPDITHPNIRFQQTRSVPREFTRTDSAPVKYHRDDTANGFTSMVDDKYGRKRDWNIAGLSSRENPLVIFTLVSQAVIGVFALLFAGALFGILGLDAVAASPLYLPLLIAMAGLQVGVLYLSTQHLGKPTRFYRGFNNLRHSPLSREALGVSLFMGFLSAHFVFSLFDHGVPGLFGSDAVAGLLPWFSPAFANGLAMVTGALAVLAGLGALYFMHAIYRIKARPFWNHWQVLTSIYGTMLSLGGVLIGLVCAGVTDAALLATLAVFVTIGLIAEGIGLVAHARDMLRQGGEGTAAHYMLTTKHGYPYLLRNAAMAVNIVAVVAFGLAEPTGIAATLLWGATGLSILLTALVGRALFYVVVIPTTMPGAFFWRNKGFEEHARETGLALMPQVGVVPDLH